MADDQSHVEIVRISFLCVERIGKLVLGLSRQNVVTIELATFRLDVQRLHPENTEIVVFLVRENVVVQLE